MVSDHFDFPRIFVVLKRAGSLKIGPETNQKSPSQLSPYPICTTLQKSACGPFAPPNCRTPRPRHPPPSQGGMSCPKAPFGFGAVCLCQCKPTPRSLQAMCLLLRTAMAKRAIAIAFGESKPKGPVVVVVGCCARSCAAMHPVPFASFMEPQSTARRK